MIRSGFRSLISGKTKEEKPRKEQPAQEKTIQVKVQPESEEAQETDVLQEELPESPEVREEGSELQEALEEISEVIAPPEESSEVQSPQNTTPEMQEQAEVQAENGLETEEEPEAEANLPEETEPVPEEELIRSEAESAEQGEMLPSEEAGKENTVSEPETEDEPFREAEIDETEVVPEIEGVPEEQEVPIEEAAPESLASENTPEAATEEAIYEEIVREDMTAESVADVVTQESIFPENPVQGATGGQRGKKEKYSCYDNREISWLRFNMRVLEEAEDRENPLAERLNFLSIYQSNLDEYFMVRVGALEDEAAENNKYQDPKSGLRPSDQIQEILKRVRKLYLREGRAYQEVLEGLRSYGVRMTNFASLGKNEAAYLEAFFKREIRPLLSPTVIGKRQPFPFLSGKYLYAVCALETKDGNRRFGIVPCTDPAFPRLIRIPRHRHAYMLTEELILHFLPQVFRNYTVKEKSVLRITRSADINTDALSEETYGYRELMERLVGSRKRLSPVRMEYSRLMSEETVKGLCERLHLSRDRAFLVSAPSDLSFIEDIRDDLHGNTELFYERRTPRRSPLVDESKPIIPQIEDHDVLLYYPYERMSPMLRMLEEAARDPDVVSIRMTLYRIAQNSEVIAALTTAAEAGKRVDVLVELKARFDEENNIRWSHVLEDAGCHVLYGVQNYKVHSKLLLITRRKGDDIEYITQVGTGNYNEKTARLYTDFCYMTAKEEIGQEAAKVFNALISSTLPDDLELLLVAPNCLADPIVEMIDREISFASVGAKAYIGMKLNSVTDKKIIDKLIEASEAGVTVELIVRGINCLRSAIPGKTDHIHVISIVGRFLEHARIYVFGTPERAKVYISSADMMTRNVRRRVEVAVPIEEPALKERIMHIFRTQLSDNVKAREQRANGAYKKMKRVETDERVNSQDVFYEEAYRAAEKG